MAIDTIRFKVGMHRRLKNTGSRGPARDRIRLSGVTGKLRVSQLRKKIITARDGEECSSCRQTARGIFPALGEPHKRAMSPNVNVDIKGLRSGGKDVS